MDKNTVNMNFADEIFCALIDWAMLLAQNDFCPFPKVFTVERRAQSHKLI